MNYVICNKDGSHDGGEWHAYVAKTDGIRYLTYKLSESYLYDTRYLANYHREKNSYMNLWHVRKVTDKELFKARLGNT